MVRAQKGGADPELPCAGSVPFGQDATRGFDDVTDSGAN